MPNRWHLQAEWKRLRLWFYDNWLMSEHLWVGSVQKEERRCQDSYTIWSRDSNSNILSDNAAKVHDTKEMDVIPYEENSFYIFDRGYNDFKRLHNIESIGAYFVVRGKSNNDFKPMKWKCRFPPKSGILSDAVGYMSGLLTMEKYPDKIRRVIYLDKESKKKSILFTNVTINSVMVAELYHNRWEIELFFKWIKQHLKIRKF